MPGSTPATSQLDWLISTTAMIVLSWSRATRDLLKSFGWGIRALHQLDAATMVPSSPPAPYHLAAGGEGIGLVARIDRLAARSGRYKRAGSFLTSDNQPCRSKRTKIAVITSRSSGTE